jgi:hypothetical protein
MVHMLDVHTKTQAGMNKAVHICQRSTAMHSTACKQHATMHPLACKPQPLPAASREPANMACATAPVQRRREVPPRGRWGPADHFMRTAQAAKEEGLGTAGHSNLHATRDVRHGCHHPAAYPEHHFTAGQTRRRERGHQNDSPTQRHADLHKPQRQPALPMVSAGALHATPHGIVRHTPLRKPSPARLHAARHRAPSSYNIPAAAGRLSMPHVTAHLSTPAQQSGT